MALYLLHGLRIESALQLPAVAVQGGDADYRVELAERRPVPALPPPGRIVAQLPDYRYAAALSDSELVCRFHDVGDFVLESATGLIRVHPSPSASLELLGLLLGGNVVALILALSARTVLHASAVRFGELTAAIVGDEGSGKSTLAALCCRAGAALVTDDVLRIEPTSEGVRWLRGSTEIRLRARAAALADGSSVRSTVDERTAVSRGTDPVPPSGPLAVVVLPRPTEATSTVQLARVSPRDALLHLAIAPRIRGLTDVESLRNQFRVLSHLARTVPVLTAELPWGPPFRADLAPSLLEGLRATALQAAGR